MFSPIFESWAWLKTVGFLRPITGLKKHRLNFITIHYLYMLGLTIFGSIVLYPGGNLDYIDALFFASGCATQSGLNTVNINDLKLYQQVVFYFITMIATPIFINTFVVFVRLYWFERHFQNIVSEARNLRRTRSRSRTKTEMLDMPDVQFKERGVDGRNIVVLHRGSSEQNGNTDGMETGKEKDAKDLESGTSSSSSSRIIFKSAVPEVPLKRDITFADEVKAENDVDSPMPRLPQRLNPEQHIAFLENQRNPKDKGTLRIPGPRDFDRGDKPFQLDGIEEGEAQEKQLTGPADQKSPDAEVPLRRNVTIEEPPRPRLRTDTATLTRRRANTGETKPLTPVEEKPQTPLNRLRSRTGTFSSMRRSNTQDKDPMPYLSWQPTIGRNSAFVDLTEEQREELGGIEYRSLKTLAIVLVCYYFMFHLLGVIIFLPWINRTATWGSVVISDGVNKSWWGIFTPASLFNDLGFTLTPDSMNSFQGSVLLLLLGSFLIIVGNTGFPCMLRFVIWIASHFVSSETGVWEELRFLLDHPRRCFTLLFPSKATWWLLWILAILNGLDIIFFVILDLNDSVVTSINPPGYRFLNGLFQAASTRTAGFSSVNLANLHPAIQVSYLVMMYISVFPIAISVRRTNVYEEKSLGIYGSSSEENEDENEPSYVGAHLRRQLSFDLWYIFLGLFIIAIAEGKHIQNNNDYAFTMFSVLFEIVSAYGTVGLSLGYPNVDTSFSGQFSVVSKLVIIAMQIRGRHRGLPYELDRAILLPSESLHRKEDEDANKRKQQRRNSSISNVEAVDQALGRTPTMASREPTVASATGHDQDHLSPAQLKKSHTGQQLHTSGSSHARTGLGKLMAGLATGPNLKHERNSSVVSY